MRSVTQQGLVANATLIPGDPSAAPRRVRVYPIKGTQTLGIDEGSGDYGVAIGDVIEVDDNAFKT